MPPDGVPFTDSDRLRLLQLRTLEVLASRQTPIESEEGDEATELEAPALVPDHWRLLNEEVILHDWQRDCLLKWRKRRRGTVKVATGAGKTTFALAAAQDTQNEAEPDLRVVIVVPTIPLMFQWRDELRQGNLPDSAIGLMGGGQAPPSAEHVRVLIAVINTARDRLPKFMKAGKWASRALLIVDESHRSNAEQAQRIFSPRTRYALGLSATPEPNDAASADALPGDYDASPVGRALGPIIFDFTVRQALEAGLLTPFEIVHLGLELSPGEARAYATLSREISDLRKELERAFRGAPPNQSFIPWCQQRARGESQLAGLASRFIALTGERKHLLYRAEARHETTLQLLQDAAADEQSRAIVFHERIDQVEKLYLAAYERGLPAAMEHSKLPSSVRDEGIEAFRKGIARCIISGKSLIEGFNVPSADVGIIAASSSSPRQRIQSLGRMLRRKEGGRQARIYVLYMRDTTDEAIYAKADWEDIVGSQRNVYCEARGGERVESQGPPRAYKPPPGNLDASSLKLGDPYPGRPIGDEVKADQANNLRLGDGRILDAPPEIAKEVVQRNPWRRAAWTTNGHLIVRVDVESDDSEDWRFLGVFRTRSEVPDANAIRLKITQHSGRRMIQRKIPGGYRSARDAASGATPEAARTLRALLDWIGAVEQQRVANVRELSWNGDDVYWIEVGGERLHPQVTVGKLDFGEKDLERG